MKKLQNKYQITKQLSKSLNKTFIIFCILVIFSSLICLNKTLDLSEFSTHAFSMFFLWLCGFLQITFICAINSIFSIENTLFWNFITSSKYQTICLGTSILFSAFVFWVFVKYYLFERSLEWARIMIGLFKCVTIWAIFQFVFTILSLAWFSNDSNFEGLEKNISDKNSVEIKAK